MYSQRRSEDQENDSLRGRQGCATQHLAQNDHRTAYRRYPHRKQKGLFSVLNHRHHGEDRSEEHNHDESAREEIIEIVLAPGPSVGAKGGTETGANHQPEEQRRSDDTDHTRALAVEANNLAP